MKQLMENSAENIDFIMPEESVNSYQLIEMSAAVFTFISTIGLEAAFMGKQSLYASKSPFYASDFSLNLDTPENLEQLIEKSISVPMSPEQLTSAYRFGYHYFIRQSLPFAQVQVQNVHFGRITYNSDEDLKPGQDEHLDHMCDVLLNGVPVIKSPDVEVDLDHHAETEHVAERMEQFNKYYQELEQELRSNRVVDEGKQTDQISTLKRHGNRSVTGKASVSVVIPCYNYAAYLREAVESVVKQTFSDWEVIIVNDGSTDNSVDVAQTLIAEYPHYRIQLIDQPNSGQPAIARNNGIKQSTGRFILALDADDYLHSKALERLMGAVEKYGEQPTVAFGWLQSFGSDDSLWSASDFNTADLLRRNQLPAGSLYHRSVWELQGGYRENVAGFEDWDFWIGAARIGATFHNVPEIVQYYRKTENTSLIDTAVVKHEWYVASIIQNNAAVYEPIELDWAQDYLQRNPEIPEQAEVHGTQDHFPAVSAVLVNSHPERYTETECEWAQQYQLDNPFHLTKRIESWQKKMKFPITAIIAAYNEGDVIYHVIRDLVEQDIQVVFIDHHSTDNTLSEVKRWQGKGVIRIESFPEDAGMKIPDDVYSWRYILRRKQDIAAEMGPGWYIHTDADEFRESPWLDLNLRAGIERVDAEGYNAINFKLFDFKPTGNNFVSGSDVRDSLSSYDLDIHTYNAVQVKCWKNFGQAVNLWELGGHDVSFDGRKIYPLPFILRHYAIRSQAHGMQKVFQDRKARFDQHERDAKWHTQYDDVTEDENQFVRDPAELVTWDRAAACTTCLDTANAQTQIDKYYEFSRPDIQELIDPKARRILDIGCAAGKMAAEIKQKLGAEVWGIEPVGKAARQAEQKLDKVVHSGIEEAMDELPDQFFDVIIFADVLEHLEDPHSILKMITGKLSRNGQIIASIPNVRHWSVVKGLLEGRWDYEDAGILDRTHLRFFTRKSVDDLFNQSGYHIISISATSFEGQGAPDKVVNALAKSGLDVASLKEDSNHYQYLVKAELTQQVAQLNADVPLVSIIMLTWNALDYTRKCVRSIEEHTDYPHEIIFVDNGSTDGTRKYLKRLVKDKPNYKLIENSENKGFAAGNNQGVDFASGKYVLLLNNDVLVADGWLSHLVSALERDEKIGMVGPITNHISGRQMITDIPYQDDLGYHEYAGGVLAQNPHKITPRRRIAGFAVLLEKTLYQEVDGLDESFGSGNFEDDDLCLKVRAGGYAIMVHEGVFIHHYGSQTFKANQIDYSASLKAKGSVFTRKWPDVNYDELIEIKNPLNEFHPNLYLAGMEHLEKSEFDAAYEIFEQLVAEDPLYEDALVGLVMAAKSSDRSEVAISSVRRLIRLNPEHAVAYNLSGLIAAESGELESAKKLFKLAWEKDKQFFDAARNLAEIMLMNDEFQAGIQILNDILTFEPYDVLTLLRLAELNLEAGRDETALELTHRVLEIDPAQPVAQQFIKSLET
ncbi:MAG: glycosyltransferase [Candidatus Marinimicrobia bacterium]|nr:glycosyltransferase [Candidatus Neomarinimicrobiota bacterium]